MDDARLGAGIAAANALASDDAEARQQAVRTLADLRGDAAAAAAASQAAKALRDPRREVRRAASSALIAVGEDGQGPAVMRQILRLLEDEDRNLRVTAMAFIGEMKGSERWLDALRAEASALHGCEDAPSGGGRRGSHASSCTAASED